jgi:hypothetical protein
MDLGSQREAILAELASERSEADRDCGELSSYAAAAVCSG